MLKAHIETPNGEDKEEEEAPRDHAGVHHESEGDSIKTRGENKMFFF